MMEPGFFPRAAAAAAHLSNSKTTKLPEFSLSSPLPIWDLHTCQALSTSSLPVPASGFTTTETAASSTDTSNYHESSVYKLPCLVHPVASTLQDPYEPEEYHFGLVSPASFSELMIRAMEISEASSNRLMLASSLPDPIIPTVIAQHSASTEGISAYLLASKLSAHVQADVLGVPPNMPGSPNSLSKQDSSVVSTAEDSDADHKHQISNSMKRRNCGLRKAQPKKVVSIPFTESKQKGEAPLCSDTWAWRKYGQKPIKGSPFPRGYYRCSSSKGCPARKQVERSRSDPTMVIVTYTADHNHQLPANRSSNSSKAGPTKGQGVKDTSSYQKAENLFSSIINSPNAVDEQVVSSMDLLQGEEESFFLQRDVDLCLSRTSTSESDGVFDNLEELPELSAIFSKGYGEGQFDDEGNCEQPEFL